MWRLICFAKSNYIVGEFFLATSPTSGFRARGKKHFSEFQMVVLEIYKSVNFNGISLQYEKAILLFTAKMNKFHTNKEFE